ncbi:unnamed protein product, partial [Mesorhabditis belari]|uniref:G-protein coupled receptors family 1 profile domain-containing protein n=1 Tax=Mesorhabditis belari TaxID=2138241 RepID=A0AAF3FJX8_9BILA
MDKHVTGAECRLPPLDASLLFDGPLSLIVIVLGVVGNLYSLRVLFRTSINTAMLVSLTGLAVWDVVLLVTAFMHHSIWASLHYLQIAESLWDPWAVALNGLLECAHITSTWMLIVVSAERFFAVTRPFHSAASMRGKPRRPSYARLIGGLIRLPLVLTALACLLTLPCSFEYRLIPCTHNDQTLNQKVKTDLMLNPYYKVLFHTLLLSIMKTFGPFVVITLLTASTVKGLRESMDCRALILLEQGKEHLFAADQDKTRSLQMISVLLLGKFLLLRCWPTAVAVAGVFFGDGIIERLLPANASEFLLLLNSATNSFVFVILKAAFESRRLKRIRMRHRQLVAQHAEQVLSIGKMLASDHILRGRIPSWPSLGSRRKADPEGNANVALVEHIELEQRNSGLSMGSFS